MCFSHYRLSHIAAELKAFWAPSHVPATNLIYLSLQDQARSTAATPSPFPSKKKNKTRSPSPEVTGDISDGGKDDGSEALRG